MTGEWLLTRRDWLLFRVIEDGAPVFLALEAVASTALAHPEWDMDEVKSASEWAAQEGEK